MRTLINVSGESRIFLRGAPTPKVGLFCKLFAKNCMKMKEFGYPREGWGRARVPGTPLDLPMNILIGLEWKHYSHLLNTNQPKFTKLSTPLLTLSRIHQCHGFNSDKSPCFNVSNMGVAFPCFNCLAKTSPVVKVASKTFQN